MTYSYLCCPSQGLTNTLLSSFTTILTCVLDGALNSVTPEKRMVVLLKLSWQFFNEEK